MCVCVCEREREREGEYRRVWEEGALRGGQREFSLSLENRRERESVV